MVIMRDIIREVYDSLKTVLPSFANFEGRSKRQIIPVSFINRQSR